MTDAERIETALGEIVAINPVVPSYWRRKARAILERLVAERAVVPGGSALVEAKREVQSLRRDLAAAQQRLAEVEGLFEDLPHRLADIACGRKWCCGCPFCQRARALLSPEAKP